MRILVGKTFGIGNSILSIPMVKALAQLGTVDVLIGSTRDDFGATDVFDRLAQAGTVGRVHKDSAPLSEEYDVAVMSIPFDGRWHNGTHFRAKTVMDGRKRPGNVDRLGFDMWEKHEIEYQMENARELGFADKTPDASFLPPSADVDPFRVYLGIGYKRDPGGFGLSKHFGNEQFAKLIDTVRLIDSRIQFVSTGGPTDLIQTGYQIIKARGNDGNYRFHTLTIDKSFDVLSSCVAYIGNDTGMMHAAASCGMPTCGLFAYADLVTKNPPFCDRSKSIVFGKDFPPIEFIAEQFVKFVWGDA